MWAPVSTAGKVKYSTNGIGKQTFPPVNEIAVNEIDFSWENELPAGITEENEWRIVFTTTLTAPKTGTYHFILHGALDAGLNRGPYAPDFAQRIGQGSADCGGLCGARKR